MTSPFRSQIATLTEQLRRVEEANAVLAEEVGELEKELALRDQLLGPARRSGPNVVWALVALATMGVGWVLSRGVRHYASKPVQTVVAVPGSPAERRVAEARANTVACQRSLEIMSASSYWCRLDRPR